MAVLASDNAEKPSSEPSSVPAAANGEADVQPLAPPATTAVDMEPELLIAVPASDNAEKPSSEPSSVPAAANGEVDVQPPAPPVKTAVDMEPELLMAVPASDNAEKPSSEPSSVPAAANGEVDVQPPAPPVKTAVDMEPELLMAVPASDNAEKPSSEPSSVPAAANGEVDVQPPAPPVKTAVDMEPELLMAARRGDSALLGRLLGVGPEVVVDVIVAPAVRRESAPAEAATGDDDQPTRTSLLDGVTAHAADSALHVVAACGDGDEFLDSASVVHGAARHLLDAVNSNGDTPVHCAARAGHARMVSRLIALARRDGAGAAAVRALLRKENKRGETALHEAVRVAGKEMVDVLLSEDPELARFPAGDSTSPLYLAVQLGHDDIARQLHDYDSELSYSGPNGQNALHAAVLRGEDDAVPTTEMLLGWNKHLTKQGDLYKTTPLHLAAWAAPPGPARRLTALLLEADPSLAYVMSSGGGSFPVHLAASKDRAGVLADLLAKYPDCADLRDAQGSTFLHHAAWKRARKVVAFACRPGRPGLARILNARDKYGNTALHIAVRVGDPAIVTCLVRNLEVRLSLEDDNGQTPLDVAWRRIPHEFNCFSINSRSLIHDGLEFIGAKRNLYPTRKQRSSSSSKPTATTKTCSQPDDDQESVLSQHMTDSAQTLGIGSVLITTVTFAAAFTLPGGYVADDHARGGAPTLAGSYAFDAFVMSITLAFACSLLATFSLMYSGVPLVDLPVRHKYFLRSHMLAVSSVRSLAAAFALGVYVVLAPVARKTAIAVCLISSTTLFYGHREVWTLLTNVRTLYVRRGARSFWALRKAIAFVILRNYWSYLIIFGWPAYSTYRPH